MNKRIISAIVSAAMAVSMFSGFAVTASAAGAKTPQYQKNARQMEVLSRGLIAVYRTQDSQNVDKTGVYLSWRLFGTESLENQAFDIYRNGSKIYTTGVHDATNWIDTTGTKSDKYKVVKAGASSAEVSAEDEATVWDNHVGSNGSNLPESLAYIDVPIERPADSNGGHYYTVDKNTEGGANDASVGDLDGDGDYEIVLKWDPTNSKDAASGGATGRTYIDAYEIGGAPEGSEHLYKWRIDLGPHVRSGAHENPFLVYDFDGDGYAEIASITGLGAVDGQGHYVTEVGDTEKIRNADNKKVYLRNGKNIGPEYYTIFDGETGAALVTTDAIPIGPTENEDGSFSPENGSFFGDSSMNRSSRYLAAVAYLDGVHPSIVMCRGYYNAAMIRAYTWDGTEMALQWEHDGHVDSTSTMYGQGNHNLSIGDIDNDGKDEIVWGSASLDDDGKKVLGNTRLGHGDAIHMSDFNNDGIQEVFTVKEKQMKKYAEDLRVASTGDHFWASGKIATSSDNGRGVMDNIDDAYAKSEYDKGNKNVMALGWSSGFPNVHDFNGDNVGEAEYKTDSSGKQVQTKGKPLGAGNGSFDNSLVYWDGDLGRELLDTNIIQKYDAATGYTTRFWGEGNGYTLTGGSTNNYTKRNASLSADLWGDWREEIIMPVGKGQTDTPVLRIYTSTIPTNYRLTTLMHDCQYRLAIAWQNVAYNQPPHTSYYIGSIALATDENGNELNYLAPAVPYTKVTYDAPAQIDVTGIEIENKEVTVEKGRAVTINASVVPENATKKGIAWSSSDEKVATVSNGKITGVGEGTAIITATSKDGGFTDTCTVTVFENPVMGVSIIADGRVTELGIGNTAKLSAKPYPENASDTAVTWSSEDESVATVSADGTVTGIGYGKTNIVAQIADKTATRIVNVKPMSIVDATGENEFETSTTLDSTVKFTGANNSASLTLEQATVPIEFHKDFEPFNKNTATLSFHFTTGGAKTDGDYIWKKGHGYNTELKFLDTEGNNIFNIVEEHTTSGNATKYIVGDGETQNASSWKKISDGSDTAWNRSQIRWDVKVTFDYAADTGTINLAGCSSAWVRGEIWETTFPLNGASFKTLKYETNNLTDWVSGTPKLEELSYVSTEQVSGNTDALYERGTANVAWSADDLTDWVQTGTDTASLALDSENGRIWYNSRKPGDSYSATKTIDGIADDAIVSYDVDWYFGSATSRTSVLEYIQFGDKLRIGWTSGYVTWVSTDGGKTWNGTEGEDGTITPDSIFDGANASYTKNVKVIFDKKANTIKSLTFDGKTIDAYTDYELPEGAAVDSVSFGLQRGGATADWDYPNGIDRIRVAQFVAGDEIPDFDTVKITDKSGNEVKTSYYLIDERDEISLIAALYDGDTLVEVKTQKVSEPTSGEWVDNTLTFNESTDGKKVKVFLWNTMQNMEPLAEVVSK